LDEQPKPLYRTVDDLPLVTNSNQLEIDMKSSTAFARFNAVMAVIAASMQKGLSFASALSTAPTYKSRGKGKGHTPAKRLGRATGKYLPHEGNRQAARAARQGLHMVNTRSGFQIMQRLPGAR
jgi:hypothetical protein